MLKNAHIWSAGPALIRALAAVASVPHTPENDGILFRGDTEDNFALKSSHPRRSGGSRYSRSVPGEGNTRNRSQCRKKSEPSWWGLHIEQLS